jgi:hypothetical protein
MTFSDYVNGKRIVVVGPAKSIDGSKQGELIDTYDIVIRFNNSIPITKQNNDDVGYRTDIICSCLEHHILSGGNVDPTLWYKEKINWVLMAYPKEIWWAKDNYNRFMKLKGDLPINIETVSLPFFQKIENDLKTRPTTGYMGINYLLTMNIKELYITGITFCSDGYAKGYKDQVDAETFKSVSNSNIHKQEPVIDHFVPMYKKDKRIKVDNALKLIIDGKK